MELGRDFQVSTLAWAENNIYSEPALLDLHKGHNEYFSLDFNRFINLKQLVVQQTISFLGGRYMEESSQRILVEAAYNGVIRREESSLRRIPHSSLPVPKFAAKILPCSAPLT